MLSLARSFSSAAYRRRYGNQALHSIAELWCSEQQRFIVLQMVTNSSVCIIPVRIIHLELVQYVWPAPRNQQGFANQALEPTLAKLGCLKQKQFPCASAIYKHVRVCHTGSQLLPGAL